MLQSAASIALHDYFIFHEWDLWNLLIFHQSELWIAKKLISAQLSRLHPRTFRLGAGVDRTMLACVSLLAAGCQTWAPASGCGGWRKLTPVVQTRTFGESVGKIIAWLQMP